MDADVGRILLDREQIQQRVRAMAGEIARAYNGAQPSLTLVPILSGSMIFLADLIRELPLKMKLALVHVSTYPGKSQSPGEPRTVLELVGDVRGRDVLIIDDILDSGRTLARVQSMVRERVPSSLRTAVLLRKPGKASPHVRADFVGFDIDDLFVVGYGLDFDDLYRNLPHICVLRAEAMR
jgi:hypoxanthine phosphoribosyltransferase